MIQAIFQTLLSKYVEPYFVGLNRKNINIQVFAGKITIFNIGLNPQFIMGLNLPIDLRYSFVQKLQAIIPWRNDEVTLILNISNIYAILVPRQQFDLHKILMKKKESIIKNVIKVFQEKATKSQKSKTRESVQNFFKKLLDNVQVHIGCIHLRYQSPNDNYSFGLLIRDIRVSTVDENDHPTFFNPEKTKQTKVRYLLSIEFLGIYFNSRQNTMLSKRGYPQITQQLNRISVMVHNTVVGRQFNYQQPQLHFILSVSVRTDLQRYIGKQQRDVKIPLYECTVDFNLIELKITHEQYNNIQDVIYFFLWYQSFWNQYIRFIELNPIKLRSSEEISNILTKKYRKKELLSPKEQQFLKRLTRKVLGWVFKSVYEDKLKNSFLAQTIKKQITIQNIMANPKLVKIIQKVKQPKLQQWLEIALKLRQQYQSITNILFRNIQSNLNQYVANTIAKKQLFHKYDEQDEDQINEAHNQREIIIGFNVSIRKLTAEISKEGIFGIGFVIRDLSVKLNTRKKNFMVQVQMRDLKVHVFSSKNYEHSRTQVSVIQRSMLLQNEDQNLLYLRYQKNPFGQPFIFSETYIEFKPIQISIYPEAFRQFYEILFADFQKFKSGRSGNKTSQKIKNSQIRSIGIQRNKIRGKVSSPWIVFPISQSNDANSQCWVVRLGDLLIQTPDYDPTTAITDRQLYYQHYKMQLRHFDLKFFSSIYYFHTWIKFNKKIDRNSSRLAVFNEERIIDVIDPFSCFVDVLILKRFVSQVIRDRKEAFIISITIKEVVIRVSKYILNKMKERVNLFDKAGQTDFIETKIKNIFSDNQVSGYARVTYRQITKTKFLAVLKGHYIYFFLDSNAQKYHFFIDIRDHTIKLISKLHSIHNEGRDKNIALYLIEAEQYPQWKKHLTHLLTRNEKVINPFKHNIQSKMSMVQSKHQNNEQQIGESSKMRVQFSMGTLSIKLINEESEFLSCRFEQTMLFYGQMRKKQFEFSIREWLVEQGSKSVFLSSNHFFKQQLVKDEQGVKNFLDVSVNFNEITNQFQNITVAVQKLFIAWKIDLFTKILVFFFYEEEFGDAPVVSTRRKMTINFKMKKFNLYCYQNQNIVALIKLVDTEVHYTNNDVQQAYDMNCQKFQMDKYIGNQMDDSVPIIICKPKLKNKMHLHYTTKREQLDSSVLKLKNILHHDLIVPQLTCTWGDSIIYYEHQQTLRLLNYFLNNILGTVGAKFKKKTFSKNFIFETLKIKKLSTFYVSITNLTFLVPPHDRVTNLFEINIDQLKMTKNLHVGYPPHSVRLKTVAEDVIIFHETMVYEISNCSINHKYGVEPSCPVTIKPINIIATQSRIRLPTQYFSILRDINDFNRLATVTVQIPSIFQLELYKIYYITLLQVFYQNLRHKDGKAQLFQLSPYPTLRQTIVAFQNFNINIYQQIDGEMRILDEFQINKFEMIMKQTGSVTNTCFSFEQLTSKLELPFFPLNRTNKQCDKPKFIIEMKSQQGTMEMKLMVQNYQIQICMDKLQNILSYIKYNNDFVSNQIMPKKKPSLQCINVFPKNCMIQLGQLAIIGNFSITYRKNFNDPTDDQTIQYIGNSEDIVDKDMSVSGDRAQCYMDGDPVGTISYIYFRRSDWSSKATKRQFRRETVHVGQCALYLQLCDLKQIYSIFQINIRKNQVDDKNFYQPWNVIEQLPKNTIRRIMHVEISKSSIFLMPTLKNEYVPHLEIEIAIPLMIYFTQKDEQSIKAQFKVQIRQMVKNVVYETIGYGKDLKIHYKNHKDKHQKIIMIENAKNIKMLLHLMNLERLSLLLEDMKDISPIRKQYGQKCKLILVNSTNKIMKMQINPPNTTSEITKTIFIMQPKQTLIVEVSPIFILELLQNQTAFNINSQIYTIYQIKKQNKSWNTHTLYFQSHQHNLIITITNTSIIKNNTNTTVNANGIIIHNHQQKSVINQTNTINIIINHQNQLLYLNSTQQQLFNGFISASIIRQPSLFVITLKSKYSISNNLPIPLQINQMMIPPFSLVDLNFTNSNIYPNYIECFSMGMRLFNINLNKSSQNIQWNVQEDLFTCKMKSIIKSDKTVTIMLYSPTIIVNKTINTVYYKHTITDRNMRSLHSAKYNILPSIDSLYIFHQDKTQQIKVQPKNNRITRLFSNLYTITQFTSSNGNLITIQDSISLKNKTSFNLQFNHHQIKPNQIYSLDIPDYFQKTIPQQLKINMSSISQDQSQPLNTIIYLRLKQGVSYISIFETMLMIQIMVTKIVEIVIYQPQQPIGYEFINEFQDFFLTVRQKNTNEEHLVKPKQKISLGLLLSFPQNESIFQISFYYDKKNIDFEQSFLIQLDNLPIDYIQQMNLQAKGDTFKIAICTEHRGKNQYSFKVMPKNKLQNIMDKIQKLHLYIKQLSLAVQVYDQDNLVFQLCGLELQRDKEGNIIQRINLKIQNMLLRQGRNLSICKFINNPKLGVSLYCSLNKSVYGNTIKYVTLSLGNLDLHGRQAIVSKLLKFVSGLRKHYKDNYQYENQDSAIVIKANQSKQKQRNKLMKGKSTIAIDQLQINPTTIYLAYSKDQQTNYEDYIDDPLLKYFILVPAINEIKVGIPRTELKQFRGEAKELAKTLLKEMKGSLGGVILSSLNSLSILDNPMEFTDNIVKYIAGLRSVF